MATKPKRPPRPVCATCGQTIWALPPSEALLEDFRTYCSDRCTPAGPRLDGAGKPIL
jgi:hypothetical protein